MLFSVMMGGEKGGRREDNSKNKEKIIRRRKKETVTESSIYTPRGEILHEKGKKGKAGSSAGIKIALTQQISSPTRKKRYWYLS